MADQYDVFISYRRDGGEQTAHMLRDALLTRGYRVFLDVETMRSGQFNVTLFDTIRQCTDFIIICSPGAFDRCVNPGDWVRLELECALKNGKKIIPLMMRNFIQPPADALPESLRGLFDFNGIIAGVDYFDAVVDKLCQNFLVSKVSVQGFIGSLWRSGKRMAIALVLLLCLIGVCVWGGFRLFKGPAYFPSAKEAACVERLLSCTELNIGKYNIALKTYLQALNELAKLGSGTSTVAWKMSFSDIVKNAMYSLSGQKDDIRQLDDMDSTLLTDAGTLVGSKLAVGDINFMAEYLQTGIDDMINNLKYLDAFYQIDESFTPHLTANINAFIELAQLDGRLVFAQFNDSFIAVDDPDTLKGIKTEFLPALTALDASPAWYTDKSDLDMTIGSIGTRQQEIVQNIAQESANLEESVAALQQALSNIDEAQKALDKGQTVGQAQEDALASSARQLTEWENHIKRLTNLKTYEGIMMNDAEAAAKKYDPFIKLYTDAYDSLNEKRNKLLASKQKLEDMKKEMEENRQTAIRKFAPLETDSTGTLWGKALRFLRINIPDMAQTCFDLYIQKDGSQDAAVYGRSAKLFVEHMAETGVRGGCVVCLFQEGVPRQDYQIGDIIFEFDGHPVYLTDDYIACKSALDGRTTAPVRILRFAQDGAYEIISVLYDTSKGAVGFLDLSELSYDQAQQASAE